MRLATLTFIGAMGAIAVPAGAFPIVPGPLKSLYVIEVADGCGLGFHRYRGSCVSHSQYRAESHSRDWYPGSTRSREDAYDRPAPSLTLPFPPNAPAEGYPYSGGGNRTYQPHYGN